MKKLLLMILSLVVANTMGAAQGTEVDQPVFRDKMGKGYSCIDLLTTKFEKNDFDTRGGLITFFEAFDKCQKLHPDYHTHRKNLPIVVMGGWLNAFKAFFTEDDMNEKLTKIQFLTEDNVEYLRDMNDQRSRNA
jgi:hypothetical protein